MAQIQSAKKRIRQTKRRTEVNRHRVNTIRSHVQKVEAAIASGDKSKAEIALREAQPHVMRGIKYKVLHRNTVARKLSRLSKRIKVMAA
jgi:small subunit ribosomal protein S20